MTKFINLTPHPISYIKEDGIVQVIPVSDTWRVSEILEPTENQVIFKSHLGNIIDKDGEQVTSDRLWDLEENINTYYIVSSIVRQKIKEIDAFTAFISPCHYERDNTGKIIGCKGFMI